MFNPILVQTSSDLEGGLASVAVLAQKQAFERFPAYAVNK
jgi:hypothetical protein